MPSGSEEINLARAAAAGDGPAFASLYEAYERRIFNYLLRLLGDRHEAEDATQDAFIRVMAKLPDLDFDDLQFGPYLYTAARNAGYDVIAKRKRMEPTGAVPEEAESPFRGQLSDLEMDPERSALASSQEAAVQEANERLPERQREVLALRELDGLSYDEIGSVMEMKPNAVAQLISRARIGLRKEMRAGAAASVALATPDCDRAHGELACRQDGQPAEDSWLDEHLADCGNCRVAAEEMAEAGVSYRAWAPVVPAAWLFREVMAKASEINGQDWSGIERPSSKDSRNGASGSGTGGGPGAAGASTRGRGRRAALVGIGSALVAGLFAILLLGDADAPERIGSVNESFTVVPTKKAAGDEADAEGKKIAKRNKDGKRVIGLDPETGEPVVISDSPDGGSVSSARTDAPASNGGGGGSGNGGNGDGSNGDGGRPSGGGGTDTPDTPPIREPVDPVDPTPPTTPPPTTPPPTPPPDPTPIPGGPPNLAIPGGPKPG